MTRRAGLTALFLSTALAAPALAAPPEFETLPAPKARHAVKATTLVEGLDHPWGMAFLPDGRILVTERTGKLRVVKDGTLRPEPIQGLPEIVEMGQGGLLDVALHPDYAANRWVYLSWAEKADAGQDAARKPRDAASGNRTVIARFKDQGDRFTDMQVLYRGTIVASRHHFGSRFAFGPDGKLYFGIGERGGQDRAQDLLDGSGKIFRLNDDGSIPADNPFAGRSDALPEIWAYGVRNPQGLVRHPETGVLWETEHGPQGGDELNIIRPGVNYGWPVITYGKTYGLGLRIGEGTEKEGMAQPELYWVPSLAVAGMTVYEGAALPFWRGDIVVALLAGGIARIDLEGGRPIAAERLLEQELGRTRAVATAPDGRLYALVDDAAPGGKLVRIERR
ncbi:PQQ-dependent sugar dehydrogenase [Oleisolibacter albus]|uniref:PQQ-dependent sugar dehydrogenase n=1 Tax=Oleisolibacter albus TaxID=2171757 RepID=UPI000DF3519C|nr:PQQ-dependent sugar dehydrogenase [Oleisolibacter albus]